MKQVRFSCQTITPMCLSGADGNTPEFRVPSLKGSLRFWWRAAQAQPNTQLLCEEDNSIFGGAGKSQGKSKFHLSIDSNFSPQNAQAVRLLSHHTGDGNCKLCNGNCKASRLFKAIPSNQMFQIGMVINPKAAMYAEMLISLVQLAAALGGLGKRSRRGFGSYIVKSVDDITVDNTAYLSYIHQLLEKISPGKYQIHNEVISIKNIPDAKYPYIMEIQLGKPFPSHSSDALLRAIGQASHDFDSDYTGTVKGARLASPIYISAAKNETGYFPVITTLKTVFPPGFQPRTPDLSQHFKGALL